MSIGSRQASQVQDEKFEEVELDVAAEESDIVTDLEEQRLLGV